MSVITDHHALQRVGDVGLQEAGLTAAIEALALEDEKIKKYTEGKTVRKVIVVPGKLVNVVV